MGEQITGHIDKDEGNHPRGPPYFTVGGWLSLKDGLPLGDERRLLVTLQGMSYQSRSSHSLIRAKMRKQAGRARNCISLLTTTDWLTFVINKYHHYTPGSLTSESSYPTLKELFHEIYQNFQIL